MSWARTGFSKPDTIYPLTGWNPDTLDRTLKASDVLDVTGADDEPDAERLPQPL